jgi:hypothetical protein
MADEVLSRGKVKPREWFRFDDEKAGPRRAINGRGNSKTASRKERRSERKKILGNDNRDQHYFEKLATASASVL